MEQARIVITHGGPSSFLMPLQIGKIPIVVPRRHEFNEHVNDHQVAFANAVAERMGTIIVVDEMDKLGSIIRNYEAMLHEIAGELKSNNARFNEELDRIASDMFKGKSQK